jgi:F0F1-type ATP synthase membrane subunit b/b'
MAGTSILDGLFPHDDAAKAQKKAEKIIKHAIKEAHSILTQATFFHKSLKESLKDELRSALDSSITLFRTELQSQTTIITDEFRKTIQKELHVMHDHLQKQAEVELKKIEDELMLYKQEKQKDIDTKLEEVLKNEMREVLHIELPEKVKRELLIKALERAKKNGFFTNS